MIDKDSKHQIKEVVMIIIDDMNHNKDAIHQYNTIDDTRQEEVDMIVVIINIIIMQQNEEDVVVHLDCHQIHHHRDQVDQALLAHHHPALLVKIKRK
jgi:hypothetical protein